MQVLAGKVAVVTGGAGGIGRALCEEFLDEGIHVVVSDLRAEAVEQTVSELSSRGQVSGHVTDVTNWESVTSLADAVYDRHGACHILCNNAGIGVPSADPWDSTLNDWRWITSVNIMGVVHGVNAFVPRMIEAGHEGHIVNTSSGNGGIAPIPNAAPYAASKAAVTAFTECLASQFRQSGSALRASIFYPAGGLLKTGLWTSEVTRPAELAREKPRTTEAMTVEKLEQQAEAGGYKLPWQDLNEVARDVIAGIRDDSFVMMLGRESIGDTIRSRADFLQKGLLPERKGSVLG